MAAHFKGTNWLGADFMLRANRGWIGPEPIGSGLPYHMLGQEPTDQADFLSQLNRPRNVFNI